MRRTKSHVRPVARVVAALMLVACEGTPPPAGGPPTVAELLRVTDAPVPQVVASAPRPAAPTPAPGPVPADGADRARTLGDLAWAADRAGDSTLAAAYRREALAYGSAPAAPAATPVATPVAAPRTRPGSVAARRNATTSRVRRSRGARRARPKARPAPPQRGIDRVFSRVERWLAGGRRVERPWP